MRRFSAIKPIVKDMLTGQIWRDVMGRQSIALDEGRLPGGLNCGIASDLMVQDVDKQGTLWATSGFHLYTLDIQQRRFVRRARLPCPMQLTTAGLLTAVQRSQHKRSGIVKLFVLPSNTLLVLMGGGLYRMGEAETSYSRVFDLRFFGPGTGRGIMSRGLEVLSSGRIVFGEYFQNDKRIPVHIYASDDDGRTWSLVYAYPRKGIRHIHALKEDPYTGTLWICTGDFSNESCIAQSSDGGESFEVVGSGSQSWRTCDLLFTEDHVYWSADTAKAIDFRFIYRYHRASGTLDRLVALDGPAELGLKLDDTLFVFGSARNSFDPGWDASPSLWVGDGDRKWIRMPISPWLKDAKPAAGRMEMLASIESQCVAVTFENMIHYDGQLVLIPFDEFRQALRNS